MAASNEEFCGRAKKRSVFGTLLDGSCADFFSPELSRPQTALFDVAGDH